MIAKEAPNLVNATENEFKRAIMQEVLKIRVLQEESTLDRKRQSLLQQDVGFFGRKKKEQEKEKSISLIDAQSNRLKAFQIEIERRGIGANYQYSARKILAEIMMGIDSSTDNIQRQRLHMLRESLEAVFRIPMDGPNGANQLYRSEKESIENDNRSDLFVEKYKELCTPQARSKSSAPDINRYLINLKETISQLGKVQEVPFNNERDF